MPVDLMDEANKVMIVAEEEGAFIGIIMVALGHLHDGDIMQQMDYMFVDEFVVLPAFRRHGVGSAMKAAA